VHSSYDSATHFASECAKEAKNLLLKAKFEIREFFGVNANSEKVQSYLQESLLEIQGFFDYGHGNEQCIFGNNGEILLDTGTAELLKNKICYVLACSAAKMLGKETVKNGGICFLGYKGVFYYSASFEEKFRICANSGIKAMITEKLTVGEAFEKMKTTFDQMILELSLTKGSNGWLAAIFLREDRYSMELIGDGSASIWQ